MRTSPVNVVDPSELAADERERLQHAADDATTSGKIDLESLPPAVREQLLFAIDAYARGESVAAVAARSALHSSSYAASSRCNR